MAVLYALPASEFNQEVLYAVGMAVKREKKKKLTTQRNHFFLCNVMVQTGARSLDEIEEPVN